MTNKVLSRDEAGDLDKARADLQNEQSRAAEELANKGHASKDTDDKVAANLQRIRNVTHKDQD